MSKSAKISAKPALPKLIVTAIVSISLAVILALQVLVNLSPVSRVPVAAYMFPTNGRALADLAVDKFKAAVVVLDGGSEHNSQAIAKQINSAYRKEPLIPEALAVLALGEDGDVVKPELLTVTKGLSRRGLILQNALLLHYANENDFDNTIAILSQLLVIQPSMRQNYLTALVRAMRDERAIAPIDRILKKNPEWTSAFLQLAIRDPLALEQVADLRTALPRQLMDPKIETQIINALISAEDPRAAFDVYQYIRGTKTRRWDGDLDWRTELPPFDWELSPNPQEKSVINQTSKSLEFKVRSGHGGIVARRLMPWPSQPADLVIHHGVEPANQAEDVQLWISCAGKNPVLVKRSFEQSPVRFTLPAPPDNCPILEMRINARAWLNRKDVTGRVSRVVLLRR